jgi:hypothetical protein
MAVNKVKCNLFDTVNKPDQFDPDLEVNILPASGETVVGVRVNNGKVYQVLTTDETLESDEAYVYGSIFGAGVGGYGYGYGFNDQDELDYFSEVERYND